MRHCLNCKAEIPGFENGNRQYCDDDCYAEAKKNRQMVQRARAAELRNQTRKAEEILRHLCLKYGSMNRINPMEAEQMGFDFGVATKNIYINGRQATIIGGFAYQITDNQTMYIWKI